MNFKNLLEKLKQRWRETNQNKKALFILTSAVVLAGVIYLVLTLTRPSYAVLLGDLEPKDAGDIVAQLDSDKIPYQLTDQGKTIMVPQDQVDDVRIKLASKGLLNGVGQGFELFDKSQFGETDFQQQISYQRALQEELRRTITSIDGVEQARVHLVIPAKSVFLDDQGTPSASVAIKLKPGAKLQPEQVRGINDLIIGSVEGLKPENVHIVDTQGNVLNDFLKDSSDTPGSFSGSSVEHQQQIRRDYEKELENRVQQMLTRILGPDKAVAMVTTDLDFNQQQTNTTEILPGPAVSERSTKENGTDAGASSGITGSTAQMPGQSVTGTGNGGQSNYTKSDDVKNYQNGTRVQSVVQAPGKVLRVSTAVVLDDSVKNLDKTQIQNIVTAAIGFDTQRGDQITVSSMTFDHSAQDLAKQLDQETKQQDNTRLYLIVGAVAAGALLLLTSIFMLIRRRRKKAEQALLEAQSAVVQQEPEAPPAPKWELPPPVDKQKELKDIAEERPDDIAQVLKVWLKE